MESSSPSTQPAVVPSRRAVMVRGKLYEPALGPWMHAVLIFIFLNVAVLGATGIYLLAVRAFEWWQDRIYQSHFSLSMFLAHIAVGVVLTVPFLAFGLYHWWTARQRPNRVAVRLGIVLFLVSVAVGLTGFALVQLDGLPQLPTGTLARTIVWWLHVALPIAAVVVYVQHRKAGPAIHWKWGYVWGLGVAGFTAAMVFMHSHDPRQWHAKGSPEGEKYFEPSKSRTVDGNFLSAEVMMMDEYCMKCHQDIYQDHLHSAHRLSSFNNPAYLFSVRETRKTAGVRASRWCAGCHDPVPFFSGQFDDPNFDDVNNPTAHAGITCTVCHSITHINSRSGNGDFTIEEPVHYPFARSEDALLQWANNQLVKAKPDLHKKTFLKPFHKTEEFCSVCHKVGLPQEVNHYKEFLRGQNHNDSFLLSGVSGHGARSFYYPPKAKENCAACHMPLKESNDFGARDFDGSGKRKVHDHLFPAANTGLAALKKYAGHEDVIRRLSDYLRNGPDGKSPTMRIDLFGLKETAGGVDAPLMGNQPLRPYLPELKPGGTYLVEVVVRTLNMGHHFTQGTADSNEVWVDFQAKAGDRILARSGGMDGGEDLGTVDPWSHFINVLMLDRYGNRIDRRNPQDIFTPLYNHQIPPGAGQVVHYRLKLPENLPVGVPIELTARVRFRKFDYRYMELVHGVGKVPPLPIVDLCEDRVLLPVAGLAEKVPAQTSPIQPAWQRWNDYGIGCFLEGGPNGKMGGELKQAEECFRRLTDAEFAGAKGAAALGWLNLARVHLAYGGLERLEAARQALIQARKVDPPAPWWTVAWFNGLIAMQYGHFDEAIGQFETILDPASQDRSRGFDFGKDIVVVNELGKAFFYRSEQESGDEAARNGFLRKAIERFHKTLTIDPEDVAAHEFLHKCYRRLQAEEREGPAGTGPLSAEAIGKMRRDGVPASGLTLDQALQLRGAWSGFSGDLGERLRTAQLLNELDRFLLPHVPELAEKLQAASPADVPDLARKLAAVLDAIGQRPKRVEAREALMPLAVGLTPGQPVELALIGLAERDVLAGGLPPTRLLALQKLRLSLATLDEAGKAEIVRTAAMPLLARTHRILHEIFKPDENAQDEAVRLHRARNPAADRASHSITIYELK